MSSHQAIVATKLGGPLQAIIVSTPTPGPDEVLIRVSWASPTPFDNWQKDFGLGVAEWPIFLGENSVGVVTAVGSAVAALNVGDTVFGFTHGEPKVKAFQEYIIVPARRLGLVPSGLDERAAATVPDNFVTAWWSFTEYLDISLPYDLPVEEKPVGHDEPILIWGGATSVGQYAIQILKQAGYTNIVTAASPRHKELLLAYGARVVVDYRAPPADVQAQLLDATAGQKYRKVLDCVAHDKKTIALYRDVVAVGGTAALLLPIQISDDAGKVVEMQSLDKDGGEFPEGVKSVGVRTHFYHTNKELYDALQPEIMPRLLGSGAIKPNAARIVEGDSLLQRVEESLRLLREGLVSGEKLVFRVNA
ncbi:GroES-like protein [Peniophora sp. CONT]|nr:GroES-like protein [Peniophora sp. CONT]